MSLPLPSLDQLQPAEFDAGELFSGQTSGRMVKGYKSPCLHTPIWDPHYLFHDAMRQVVVWLSSTNFGEPPSERRTRRPGVRGEKAGETPKDRLLAVQVSVPGLETAT